MGTPNINGSGRVNTKFINWNTKGLNHPVKRSKVFSHLSKLRTDIAFLTETHLLDKDHSRLKRGGFSQIFHSKFSAKCRGAAILIHREVQFIQTNMIQDKDGRFIIIQGLLFNIPVVLACVYAPNWDNAKFFTDFFALLPELDSHQLVLGGDLNCVLDPAVDRSRAAPGTLSKSAETINAFLQMYGMIDAWRYRNPVSRQYSFFSPVHNSYSRIDYFLLDKRLLPLLRSSEYESIVISDHSPVIMELYFPDNEPPQRTWRLNPRLLSDEDFVNFLSAQIDFFLETNQSPDTSHSNLWETMKAYLRGQIISYNASMNRRRSARLNELISLIKEVDHKNSEAPSVDLCKERIGLLTEFDILSSGVAEELHLRSRQEFYEHGERASKLLSHQLRQSAEAGFIAEINTPEGITTDQRKINIHFRKFYEDLYTSENCDSTKLAQFFDSLEIPIIGQQDRADLDSNILTSEIDQAIKRMKSGKAPGPDGFPIEFFKKFSFKLSPLLKNVYSEILERATLPPTMTQANISVLLKKGKDPLKCESFRPVSLLCCDYKILTKVLASRLESVMGTVIHPDQTGFIRGRQLFSNIPRLFNILYSPETRPTAEVLLSLDAHKAFDRIEYEYLFATLERFGFGSVFCSWIKILYSSPQASVRTNKIISNYFPIGRGTRQGCPLSPLLFDLAIEPLTIALRRAKDLVGVVRGNQIHKLSLYADDLVLYLSDPGTSIPKALEIISSFGEISGYKINFTKSLLFPINDQARHMSFGAYPLKETRDSFTYLGVTITRKYSDLFKHNLKPALERVKQDLTRWSALPISLAGRVNSVKMIIMPRFLFLFHTIPIFIPKSFFRELDKLIATFIWNKTIPRIRKAHLEKQKEAGGLALPNFLQYYWAANIYKLMHWVSASYEGGGPVWVEMEQYSALPVSLPSLVCAPLPLSKQRLTNNPIVSSSLRIWSQFRTHFKHRKAMPSLPISANALFPPSLMDTAFKLWFGKGLKRVKDLFKDGVFMSFEQLVNEYNIPSSHYFRYQQVRVFVRKHFPSFPLTSPNDWMDEWLEQDLNQRGGVSRVYEDIQMIASPSLNHIRARWEEDLGSEMSDASWQSAIKRIHSTSMCIRHGLLQFKVLHRLYLSRSRLARMYPDVDPTCFRCCQAPATLYHMFWACPKLIQFWSLFFDTFSYICDREISPAPEIAIFGVTPAGLTMSRAQKDAIAFSSLLARRLILCNWKSSIPPTHKRWVEDVMAHLKLEKLKHTLRGSTQRFYEVWQPFLNYFNLRFSARNTVT